MGRGGIKRRNVNWYGDFVGGEFKKTNIMTCMGVGVEMNHNFENTKSSVLGLDSEIQKILHWVCMSWKKPQ